jgi:hypothetical protein
MMYPSAGGGNNFSPKAKNLLWLFPHWLGLKDEALK